MKGFARRVAVSPVLVLALAFTACTSLSRQTDNSGDPPWERADFPADRVVLEVVSRYVQETRGWADCEYDVEERGYRGIYNVAWVIHRDDEWTPTMAGGGGQSFVVEVNRKEVRVERELAFQ